MAIESSSLYHFVGLFVFLTFIHVDHDSAVPASCDYSKIITTISNERNLSIRIMRFKLMRLNSAQKIKHLDLSLGRADDQLPVIFIELHVRDVCFVIFEHIFENSYRFTCLCIPNFDRPLPSYINFEVLIAELGAADWVIVGDIRNERPLVLENFELT